MISVTPSVGSEAGTPVNILGWEMLPQEKVRTGYEGWFAFSRWVREERSSEEEEKENLQAPVTASTILNLDSSQVYWFAQASTKNQSQSLDLNSGLQTISQMLCHWVTHAPSWPSLTLWWKEACEETSTTAVHMVFLLPFLLISSSFSTHWSWSLFKLF